VKLSRVGAANAWRPWNRNALKWAFFDDKELRAGGVGEEDFNALVMVWEKWFGKKKPRLVGRGLMLIEQCL